MPSEAIGVERIRRLVVYVAAFFYGGLTGATGFSASLQVDVYSSPDSVVQMEVLVALEAELAVQNDATIELRRHEVDTQRGLDQRRLPDLRIAIGAKAAAWLSRQQATVPRLYGFIPRATWDEIADCCVSEQALDSALYLDRPAVQYLRLAQVLIPGVKRIGVLFGPASVLSEMRFRAATEGLGLELVAQSIGEGERVGAALRPLLDRTEMLLALPDPDVFNRNTVFPVLLASYGARLPVVAYSSAMVRAGAAAAVLLSPPDAGRDLAAEIVRFANERRLGPPRHSPTTSITVNRNVVRSLGLDVGGLDELTEQVLWGGTP